MALATPPAAALVGAAIDRATHLAHLPALVGGILVAASFGGAGYVVGTRFHDALPVPRIVAVVAFAAALYAALTAVWLARVGAPAAATLPAAVLSAAIAAAACGAGIRTARRS